VIAVGVFAIVFSPLSALLDAHVIICNIINIYCLDAGGIECVESSAKIRPTTRVWERGVWRGRIRSKSLYFVCRYGEWDVDDVLGVDCMRGDTLSHIPAYAIPQVRYGLCPTID
jgi:hypothetical protein